MNKIKFNSAATFKQTDKKGQRISVKAGEVVDSLPKEVLQSSFFKGLVQQGRAHYVSDAPAVNENKLTAELKAALDDKNKEMDKVCADLKEANAKIDKLTAELKAASKG